MVNKLLIINRETFTDKQVTGTGYIIEDCQKIFTFKTLELPWLNNQRNISCIPPGVYPIHSIISKNLGSCYAVECVPNRSLIRIHAGNFYTDIQGCILVGSSLKDINGDGVLDVINSKKTLEKIKQILPYKTYLFIMENNKWI